MKHDKARRKKGKKGKGKPAKPKTRAKRRKPDGLDVAVFRTDDLFKGRKAGSFSLSEESSDEQMQGFLAEFSERAPGYVEQGAFIVQGKDGRWKVVVFGGTDFEDVMGKVLRVGILGLAQGTED